MTEEKINEVIKSESEESLMFQALMQILADRKSEEIECALAPDLTDSGRAFNNGRAAAIIDLINIIEEKRA